MTLSRKRRFKFNRKHPLNLKKMYKLQSNNRIFLDLSLHKKWKFSIKDFFRSFLQIWSHLLKKSLMENFIFLCSVKIFRIRIFSVPYLPAFGEIRNISLYLVRMQQNTDQKSSKHGQFSRSGDLSFWSLKIWVYSQQTDFESEGSFILWFF